MFIDNIGSPFWRTSWFIQKGVVEWLKVIHQYLFHTSHTLTFWLTRILNYWLCQITLSLIIEWLRLTSKLKYIHCYIFFWNWHLKRAFYAVLHTSSITLQLLFYLVSMTTFWISFKRYNILKLLMRTLTTVSWLLLVLKVCRRVILIVWGGLGGTPRPQAEAAKVVTRTVQGCLLVTYMI